MGQTLGPDCDYELSSVKQDLIHIADGATIFFNTVPCPRPSIFTSLPNSKTYAEVKLPASPEKVIDAILGAINKRHNTDSYAVNNDSQCEAVQVLIHVWS